MNSDSSTNGMHENRDPERPECPDSGDDVGEAMEQEFANVDEALDQIGLYLDQLEEKNDSIYARLQDLLESSRQTRQEMEAERLASEQAQKGNTSQSGPSDSSRGHSDSCGGPSKQH